MVKKPIESLKSPPPVGPYSSALAVGPFVFISGQIPLCTDGSLVQGDIQDEVHQVMKNITVLLNEAGCDWSNVVKVGIFTTDLSQFDAINDVYKEYVKQPFPARAAVEVAALPKQVRVEMEAVAYVE